ncbi:glycosyltransferase [Parabacteroides sp. FAFU027]|uniref:glycosyltransferase n=1 Tax=Parabacteroides sp. FAFU027 TaxID=2922715 RepID=UPI001FAF44AE|nr:glycosyltransferase [Parabacteroides sp. FAFU027]
MQKDKHIHIVSFDNPYPPDYGGAIDVLFKLKAFQEAGIDVTLHIFEYKRCNRGELEKYCTKVNYYHRPTSLWYQFSALPFIVNTRKSKSLLDNLLRDNDPILFEGLHTTLFLNHPALAKRTKIVRTHNIEHEYYTLLAHREKNWLKKIYFRIEAFKLKRYEPNLAFASGIAAISQTDCEYFRILNSNTRCVGAFHPFSGIDCQKGTGEYILYHGNLEVAENQEAAAYILNNLTAEMELPLIIAGKNPPDKLLQQCQRFSNVKIIGNPSDKEMAGLITNAQIHLLPTFQPTGVKLKLLYALFSGRHVLVTPEMVIGSDLQNICVVCHSPVEFKQQIRRLYKQPFDEQMLSNRQSALTEHYNNQQNIAKLQDLLFS